MRSAIRPRFAGTALALLAAVGIAAASTAPRYVLEMTLRGADEAPGHPFVATVGLDSRSAQILLADPAVNVRPHLLEARKAYAVSRGYEPPAFQRQPWQIPQLTEWSWRLREPGSPEPLAEGGNRTVFSRAP